jgi:hypothetical protein
MSINNSSADPRGLGTTGAVLASATLRQIARRALEVRAGEARGVESLAAAANAAYDDLVRVAVPVIGQEGVDALVGRAFHLVRPEFPWLVPPSGPDRRAGAFAHGTLSLQHQDPAAATDAAAAVFATFAGLLVTFIGESLTTRLLNKAWPDAFSVPNSKEREA